MVNDARDVCDGLRSNSTFRRHNRLIHQHRARTEATAHAPIFSKVYRIFDRGIVGYSHKQSGDRAVLRSCWKILAVSYMRFVDQSAGEPVRKCAHEARHKKVVTAESALHHRVLKSLKRDVETTRVYAGAVFADSSAASVMRARGCPPPRRRHVALGIACVAALSLCVRGEDLIRGLPRSKQSLYRNGISCVPRDGGPGASDPVHIPIDRINDDYCDCEDGSDEPGTAASCDNARFYCVNAGHKGVYIPSAHVDDGACDCCDGSDEPRGKCPDICAVEGESALKAAKAKADVILKGVAARKKMRGEGQRLIREDRRELESLKARVSALASEISAAEKRAEILKVIRDAAERLHVPAKDGKPAAGDPIIGTDLPPPGVDVDVDDLESGPADGEGIADDNVLDNVPEDVPDDVPGDVPVDVSEAGLDAAGDAAIDAGNGSQVDEVVATANEDALCAELATSGSRNRVFAVAEYYRALTLSKLHKALPAKLRPVFGASSNAPRAGACLDKAEDAARKLRSEKSDKEAQVNAIEGKLSSDFIADPSLRSLHGKCVKGKFTQYEFELCLFDRVEQYEHGSSIARLGSWESWKAGSSPNSVMIYNGGDQCWNGPKRSTTVYIECGDVDEIMSVDEPNRCMYQMRFKTPAACEAVDADAVLSAAAMGEGEDEPKDEL